MKGKSNPGNAPARVQDALGNVNVAARYACTDPENIINLHNTENSTHRQKNASVPQNILVQDMEIQRCRATNQLIQGQFQASQEDDFSQYAQERDDEMHAKWERLMKE